jgi:hypothetical protein
MFANGRKGDLRIDWEALGIPLDVATNEMRGTDLADGEFDPRLIDKDRSVLSDW